MIRDLFRDVGGIGLYGIVSTLIFFALFVGILVRVLVMKKAHVDEAGKLPLEPEDTTRETGEG